jgi:hypothetical protein
MVNAEQATSKGRELSIQFPDASEKLLTNGVGDLTLRVSPKAQARQEHLL